MALSNKVWDFIRDVVFMLTAVFCAVAIWHEQWDAATFWLLLAWMHIWVRRD